MPKGLIREGHLKDIGDAIRAQLGVTTRYLPGQMAAAVLSITSGGASPSFTPHASGAEGLVDEAHMTALGNAIRRKLGVTTRFLPGQMAAAIRSIAPSSRTLVSIAITTLPVKTIYETGDDLELAGIVVTATYSDTSTVDVTDRCTFSPDEGEIYMLQGAYTVSASYTENNVTATAGFRILVAEPGVALLLLAVTSTPVYPDPGLTQTLCFSQSEPNGVAIDWGDGSAAETAAGTATTVDGVTSYAVQIAHTYATGGDYLVALTAGAGVSWTPGSQRTNMLNADSSWYVESPQLKALALSSAIQKLTGNAFMACSSLQALAIPDSVTEISGDAFNLCTALSRVHVSKGLLTMDPEAFFQCIALTAFSADEDNPAFSVTGGVLYSKTRDTLVAFPAGKSGAVSFPAETYKIGDKAFMGAELEQISIPYRITEVGYHAFYFSKLKKVTLAAQRVEANAFEYCRYLEAVWIRRTCTELPGDSDAAFYGALMTTVLYAEPAARPSGWNTDFDVCGIGSHGAVRFSVVWGQTTSPF